MAEGDEIRVPGLPIAARQNFAEGHFGGEWRFGVDEAEAIGDAMDVDVDADGWEVEADGDGEVGGFASDAWEFAELFDGVREDVIEFFVEGARQFFEVVGFGVVVADGVDESSEGLFGDAVEVGRGEGAGARGGLEEACGGFGGTGVFCAGGEDGGDEDAEGVARLGFEEVDDGGRVRREFAAQDTIDLRYIIDCHGVYYTIFGERVQEGKNGKW